MTNPAVKVVGEGIKKQTFYLLEFDRHIKEQEEAIDNLQTKFPLNSQGRRQNIIQARNEIQVTLKKLNVGRKGISLCLLEYTRISKPLASFIDHSPISNVTFNGVAKEIKLLEERLRNFTVVEMVTIPNPSPLSKPPDLSRTQPPSVVQVPAPVQVPVQVQFTPRPISNQEKEKEIVKKIGQVESFLKSTRDHFNSTKRSISQEDRPQILKEYSNKISVKTSELKKLQAELLVLRETSSLVNSEYGQIVDIFLKCRPQRLTKLAHHIDHQSSIIDNNDRTHDQYNSFIVPLMFEELKEQIVSKITDSGATVNGHDGLLNLFKIQSVATKVKSLTADSTGMLLDFNYKAESRDKDLYKEDLVLLQINAKPTPLYVFAQVISAPLPNGKSDQSCRVYIIDEETLAPHTTEFIEALANLRKTKTEFYVSKVANLITFERELKSIKQFTSHRLSKLVLSPRTFIEDRKNMIVKKQSFIIPSHLDLGNLNPSQLSAIQKSMIQDELTLIQGPPGTGKTTIILNLLRIFHSILGEKETILVCAPSNTAVDEVGLRLLDDGLGLGSETPDIVRIGRLEAVNKKVHSICINKHSKFKEKKRMIREARILLTTLSGAASKILDASPSVIIIDESTQSCEPSTLIPLLLNPNSKVILIGDPKQLPPTVFSKISSRHGYNVSLFERLSNYLPVHMLDTQYRMHPSISKFPSQRFYQSKLKDGENVVKYTNSFYNNAKYGPINFYNIPESQEVSENGNSLKNILESKYVFVLLKKLVQEYPEVKKMSVGIITPYKLQKKELLEARGAFNEKMDVVVNTVDGFQGAEKDIIIFSCVRNKRIGFLSDIRRINVGITRARKAIYVVGKQFIINSGGIDILQEEIRQHDLRHPNGLIVSNGKSDEEELEVFFSSSKDQPFGHGDEDDESDGDDNETEADKLVNSISNLSINPTAANYVELLIKQVEIDISHYNKIKADRNSETKVQAKSAYSRVKNNLGQLVGHQKINISSSQPQLDITDNTINGLLSTAFTDKKCSGETLSTKKSSWNDLLELLKINFPKDSFEAYGSFVNGIQLESSDIDVCFKTSFDTSDPVRRVDLMKSVARCLLAKRDDQGNRDYQLVRLLDSIKVPIIKFTDLKHRVSYDMCFNNRLAIGNSLLVKSYAEIDERAKQLMLLVKYWASRKDINDASGGTLSSYAWLNMVIFYLQTVQPPVLPSLHSNVYSKSDGQLVQSKVDRWKFVDHRHTGFVSQNNKTLFQLFYGFFNFYCKFDFKDQLICIRLGKPTSNRMASQSYMEQNDQSKICIEDPFNTSSNPGSSVQSTSFNIIIFEFMSMKSKLQQLAVSTNNQKIIHQQDFDHLFSKSLKLNELYKKSK
ncbi:Regulator of nonsense transcripts 1 like protein [Cavenderia fasciculata]|uniref:Regulator of nonsense transcripts 1 like protein n=1 Tax=Cavenderia fasciculata TaxID=261658 RepID=F4Q8Z5_CACFS|nr:Regulator of nonsense transcripts 1 like protein [Cavenderia fasciculata]EGG15164.1 Regulator of nonsense transcripts 1 like protein [Cavenderia fasciculata]|eukprot:XP_004351884.1 Regulator of nonsense transcripts 1 like protein [Cavenderia fasciculata]